MTDDSRARSLALRSLVLSGCVPVLIVLAFAFGNRISVGRTLIVASGVLAVVLAIAAVVWASGSLAAGRRSKTAGARTLPRVALTVSIVVTVVLCLFIGLVVLILIGLSNLS